MDYRCVTNKSMYLYRLCTANPQVKAKMNLPKCSYIDKIGLNMKGHSLASLGLSVGEKLIIKVLLNSSIKFL